MPDGRPVRLALLRCGPEAESSGRLAEWLSETSRDDDGPRLFLHGDGVEFAANGWGAKIADLAGPRAVLDVCRTSWRRRHAESPPPPFRQATLAGLCRAIRERADIGCIGLLACEQSAEPRAPSIRADARRRPCELLIEIGFAPRGRFQAVEALEFALAAAALELDARVRFFGPGLAHLAGANGRGWRQLTDFELLDLFADRAASAGAHEPVVPVDWLDEHELARMRAEAATIIRL